MTRPATMASYAPTLSLPKAGNLLRRLVAWPALARQRRALLDLDATRLADLGLTLEEARAEAGRPFWDAPRHWR